MIVEVRKAIESEIDVLLSFETEIIKTERPFDNSLGEGDIHYYDLIGLIRAERAEVLVAVVENEIVVEIFCLKFCIQPKIMFFIFR